MLKSILLRCMRALGLAALADRAWYGFNRLCNSGRNRRFRTTHPGLTLPPDYMLYESYRLDQQLYYTDGQATAQWICAQLEPYGSLATATVLDWGCGPARVIRHLPQLLPGARLAGSDYNEATIEWCRAHIAGIDFRSNGVQPPLDFGRDTFDAAYALSVLTHLSEEAQVAWMTELYRVLKPGGLLLLTTHGAAFEEKLTAGEKLRFRRGECIEHPVEQEGHRSYSSFQPRAFMERLFSRNWQLLNFAAGKQHAWGPEQDTWIVRKKSVMVMSNE
ncbi:MAG: class I SAM-dependent methyltransferase [Chitinophagaceae bacterium]|nr:MAG: class I SAM-dependent methyltransferase [Chitinophagaceae bacterium]